MVIKRQIPIVVLADLDALGCVDQFSRTDAGMALKQLAGERVPLVLCSSKTRAEIEAIRRDLGIHAPFVCESGSAAFIPSGYFGFNGPGTRSVPGYEVFEFGRSRAQVVRALQRTAGHLGISVIGFSDMSVEEVANECGLSLLQARLAKLRDYTERFRVRDGNEGSRLRLLKALKAEHVRCVVGSSYDQVGGPADDRSSVNLLRALYIRTYGAVFTVLLADLMADKAGRGRDGVCTDDPTRSHVDVMRWVEAIHAIVEDLRGESVQPGVWGVS